MYAFLLGTGTALLWGTGDFLVRGVSARLGTAGALFYSHVVLLLAVAASATVLGLGPDAPGARGWLLGAGGAVLNLMMIASLYRALHHGPLPVVAPIIASYAAVTTLVALATGTATLQFVPALCLGVILCGVLLAAVEPASEKGSRIGPGVGWALVTALFSGLLSWVQGIAIIPVLGEVRSLLLNTVFVLAIAGAVAARGGRLSLGAIDPRVVALGLSMAGGFLAFFYGLGTGEVVIVSVLSSMCGAVTALLGALVAKQPASRLQWCGGAMILTGVIALKAL